MALKFCSYLIICLIVLQMTIISVGHATAEEPEPAELETIVVTTEKRERNLHDVPASITVIGSEDLENAGGKSLVDATTLVPNVIVQNQGGRTGTYFYARGIGRSELNYPIVSVNINGIALPDPCFFGLDLDAAEQVEFLRGPQGTLYGQNTLGGVINIRLKEPADYFSGSVEALMGERNYKETALRLEGPVNSWIRMAGTLLLNDIDGFIDNPTRAETQNPEQTVGASLFVIADPTDELSLEFNYFGQNRDDGLPQFAQSSHPFVMTNDVATEEQFQSDVFGLKAAYNYGTAILESQTGFVRSAREQQNDLDFSPYSLAVSRADVDIDQWTQEFRLLGNTGKQVEYIIGVYGSGLSNNFDVYIDDLTGGYYALGAPARIRDLIRYEDLTLAGFGQVNWHLGAWELIAGLRYQYQKIETDNLNTQTSLGNPQTALAPSTNMADKASYSELLPRLAATYEILDPLKLYGSVSRGFRAGGFNDTVLTASRLGIDLPTSYGPEYTWNYEIGAKWILPGHIGFIDTSLFYIDWSDMQAEQIAPDTLIDYRTNAASATSVGGEIELKLFPCDGWEIGSNLGYAHATYDKYIDELTGEDLSGNQVSGGAEFTWSLTASYINEQMFGPVGIKGRLSANGALGRYFDSQNDMPGDDYAIFNARFGVTYKNWEAFVFGRNLFDEQYVEYEYSGFGLVVNDPRILGFGIKYQW